MKNSLDGKMADYTPIHITFPLAENAQREKTINEKEAAEPLPSQIAIEEAKKWVDFKEM